MESEFLTEPTRKLRKSLLIASLIGFAISYAGLRVSEISLLGSKLSITKFDVIPFVLGIIVSYFLVTFIIFGLYEYAQSYRKRRFDILERISKGEVYSPRESEIAFHQLKYELEELEKKAGFSMLTPRDSSRYEDRAQEIKQEIRKLERVREFYTHYKGSIFERLRIRGMKTFFDLFVPIFIGLYVAILLFFFTKIPELEGAIPKPGKDVVIGLRLSLDDANNVTSYSLIENSERDEENE